MAFKRLLEREEQVSKESADNALAEKISSITEVFEHFSLGDITEESLYWYLVLYIQNYPKDTNPYEVIINAIINKYFEGPCDLEILSRMPFLIKYIRGNPTHAYTLKGYFSILQEIYDSDNAKDYLNPEIKKLFEPKKQKLMNELKLRSPTEYMKRKTVWSTAISTIVLHCYSRIEVNKLDDLANYTKSEYLSLRTLHRVGRTFPDIIEEIVEAIGLHLKIDSTK